MLQPEYAFNSSVSGIFYLFPVSLLIEFYFVVFVSHTFTWLMSVREINIDFYNTYLLLNQYCRLDYGNKSVLLVCNFEYIDTTNRTDFHMSKNNIFLLFPNESHKKLQRIRDLNIATTMQP